MPKGLTAVLNQPGKPLELETLPTPEVEPGGVLIKNTAAAICGSDLHYWRNDGNYQGPDLRRVPGHEFTGVVHSLGRGVETDSLRRPLKEGDRVAFPFFNPCNRCYWCIRGEHHACPRGPGIGVTFDRVTRRRPSSLERSRRRDGGNQPTDISMIDRRSYRLRLCRWPEPPTMRANAAGITLPGLVRAPPRAGAGRPLGARPTKPRAVEGSQSTIARGGGGKPSSSPARIVPRRPASR